jgi:hypothetical protein
MRRLRQGAARDQSDSAFSAILRRLCDGCGALAAALVDSEGETVDYAGLLSPYEIKVAAAEWRIVLTVLHASRLVGFQQTSGLSVRARGRSYCIEAMPDGYAIALCLPRYSSTVSRRALSQAMRELGREAGLEVPLGRAEASWIQVKVRLAGPTRLHRRPDAIWLENAWSPLIILGRYQARDLSRSELGYLARLASGAEVFLVREPLGAWFIDNPAALGG